MIKSKAVSPLVSLCAIATLVAACGGLPTNDKKSSASAQGTGSSSANQGGLTLTEPTLSGAVAQLTQVALTVSQNGKSVYTTTVPYQPNGTLSASSLAAGHYDIDIAVSTNGKQQFDGKSAADIVAGQTTTATVQLAADGNGALNVQILAPGTSTACSLLNQINAEPMDALCEVGQFACTYTTADGKSFASGTQSCGQIYAQRALLTALCNANEPLTQAEYDTGFSCSGSEPLPVALPVTTPVTSTTPASGATASNPGTTK